MLQTKSSEKFCCHEPVDSYFSLILRNPLFTWFPWQHPLPIPILPPWILLFSLIFKLLFLKVWSLVLFSTTLLDKSSIIPRVTVSNSQASLPTTPHFLFSLWSQSQVTASLSLELLKLEILVALVPFSSSFPHIQCMDRFCSSCLLNTCWNNFLFISLPTALSILNDYNRLVCFYFCFISIHSSNCNEKNLSKTHTLSKIKLLPCLKYPAESACSHAKF